MNDAATKRSDDSKLIVTKEGEKAEQAGKLEESKEAKRTKSGQLDVLESQIANTHKVCDFLLAEYAKIKGEAGGEQRGEADEERPAGRPRVADCQHAQGLRLPPGRVRKDQGGTHEGGRGLEGIQAGPLWRQGLPPTLRPHGRGALGPSAAEGARAMAIARSRGSSVKFRRDPHPFTRR